MTTKNGIKYINDLKERDWKYAGGVKFSDHDPKNTYDKKKNNHFNYWNIFKKSYHLCDDDLPKFTDKCLCNHTIKYNCYIIDTQNLEMLVVGNCCIKKFTKGKLRTCEMCGKNHKNRKDNICKDCRV